MAGTWKKALAALWAAGALMTVAAGQDWEVDLLIVYTPSLESRYGGRDGVEALALAAIESSNEAYADSDCDLRIRLVGLERVEYEESSTDMEDDLRRLTNRDGVMDEALDWRNEFGADLVYLFREDRYEVDSIGIAWLLGNTFGDASSGFGVVSGEYALGELVLQHEIGHNHGAGHDRENTENGGIYSFSYGHRFYPANGGGQIRTVMAYSPGWEINLFSSPLIRYEGTPTGIAEGQPGSADNARTLRATANDVAGYREAKPIPPRAVAGADVIVEDLDGDGSERVTLDGSGSSDWDGIASWRWTWPGGSAEGETAVATFSEGKHVVTLTVTDTDGLRAMDTLEVEVLGYSAIVDVFAAPNRLFQVREDGRVKASGALYALGVGDGVESKVANPQFVKLEGIKLIRGSEGHTLFLNENGGLFAAGSNPNDHLGTGAGAGGYQTPVMLIESGVVDMAAGKDFSVWVLEDGSLWGVGENRWGSLGPIDGSEVSRRRKLIDAGVISVVAGDAFTAALRGDGSLWVTGRVLKDWFSVYPDIYRFQEIVPSGVVEIAAGSDHLLYRDVAGRVWAFGENQSGQLGLGNTGRWHGKWELASSGATSIFAADGVSIVGFDDGSFWLAGRGIPDGENLAPLERFLRRVAGQRVGSVALSDTTLAVLLKDGSLWASGSNREGGFGIGTTASEPQPWTQLRPPYSNTGVSNLAPRAIVGSPRVFFDDDGDGYGTARLDATVSVDDWRIERFRWAWEAGESEGGQIEALLPEGVNNVTLTVYDDEGASHSIIVPIEIRPLSPARSVEAGGDRFFVLREDGSLWGYGSKTDAALGLPPGDYSHREYALLIRSGVRDVVSKGDYTLVLMDDGSLWGAGDLWGLEGTEDPGARLAGFRRLVESGAEKIAGSSYHAMYIDVEGVLYGAGGNYNGQMGESFSTSGSFESLYDGRISSVVTDEYATIALSEEGKALAASSVIELNVTGEAESGWAELSGLSVEELLFVSSKSVVFRDETGCVWIAPLALDGIHQLGDFHFQGNVLAREIFGEDLLAFGGSVALGESGSLYTIGLNDLLAQENRGPDKRPTKLATSGVVAFGNSEEHVVAAFEDGSVWGASQSWSDSSWASPWPDFRQNGLVSLAVATDDDRENQAPVAVAPSVIEEYDLWEQGEQEVVIDGSLSHDDRFIKRWIWRTMGRQWEGRYLKTFFPVGETPVTLRVEDGEGFSGETTFRVHVKERPPIKSIHSSYSFIAIVLESGASYGAGSTLRSLFSWYTEFSADAKGLRFDISSVQKVENGHKFFVALDAAGAVWAVSEGLNDLLGLGSRSVGMPLTKIIDGGVRDIAANGSFAAVVTDDGALWTHGPEKGEGDWQLLPRSELKGWRKRVTSGVNGVSLLGSSLVHWNADGSLWLRDLADIGSFSEPSRQLLPDGVREVSVSISGIYVILSDGRLIVRSVPAWPLLEEAERLPGMGEWKIVSEGRVVAVRGQQDWVAWQESDGSLWGLGESAMFAWRERDYFPSRFVRPTQLFAKGIRSFATTDSTIVAVHENDGLLAGGRLELIAIERGTGDWIRRGGWRYKGTGLQAMDHLPPSANAGADRRIFVKPGTGSVLIGLDGTLSTDDVRIAGWSWEVSPEEVGPIDNEAMPTVWLREGTFEFFLTVTDLANNASTDEVVVEVLGEVAFGAWLEEGDPDRNYTDLWAWAAKDDDGDGIDLFDEWRLGLDPAVANLGPWLRVEPEGQRIWLWLDGVREGQSPRVMTSKDLLTWDDAGLSFEWVEERRARANLGSTPGEFFKVEFD